MANHAVNTVVVADNDPNAQAWHTLASACCEKQQSVGGVTLYKAAPGALAPYTTITALEMGQRADSVLFDTLLLAADRWLADGNSLERLNPLEVQQHGLLPASWLTGPIEAGWSIRENLVGDPSGRYHFGAWLGPMPGGHASVGVYGSYAALEPLIGRYRQNAVRVYFPYPPLPAPEAAAGLADTHGLMVMEFDREGLAAAAAHARIFASTIHAKKP
jgi:hypothetical protein